MRKIKSTIVIFFTLIFLPIYGYAFQNEPNGFRDLYWGESLEEVQQNRETRFFSVRKDTNSILFTVVLNDNEPQAVSNVRIWGGAFVASFWANKLYAIAIFFSEEDAFERLKSSMTILYGTPMATDDACAWIGTDTLIILDKADKESTGCVIHLSSIKIFAEISEETARQGW